MNRKHDLRTKHIPNNIKRRVESESDNPLKNDVNDKTGEPIMNDEADRSNFHRYNFLDKKKRVLSKHIIRHK